MSKKKSEFICGILDKFFVIEEFSLEGDKIRKIESFQYDPKSRRLFRVESNEKPRIQRDLEFTLNSNPHRVEIEKTNVTLLHNPDQREWSDPIIYAYPGPDQKELKQVSLNRAPMYLKAQISYPLITFENLERISQVAEEASYLHLSLSKINFGMPLPGQVGTQYSDFLCSKIPFEGDKVQLRKSFQNLSLADSSENSPTEESQIKDPNNKETSIPDDLAKRIEKFSII